MYLYNNVFNMLWEHVKKFEMNIKYPKHFLNIVTHPFKQ
jgi:hypothetical protein